MKIRGKTLLLASLIMPCIGIALDEGGPGGGGQPISSNALGMPNCPDLQTEEGRTLWEKYCGEIKAWLGDMSVDEFVAWLEKSKKDQSNNQ